MWWIYPQASQPLSSNFYSSRDQETVEIFCHSDSSDFETQKFSFCFYKEIEHSKSSVNIIIRCVHPCTAQYRNSASSNSCISLECWAANTLSASSSSSLRIPCRSTQCAASLIRCKWQLRTVAVIELHGCASSHHHQQQQQQQQAETESFWAVACQ